MMMAGAARPGRGGDVLAEWAQTLTGQAAGRSRGRLRFAFYGRVSTEDWQDPVTSRARQLQQAVMLVGGHGVIVAEFFDIGESRTLPWARRPQAAALVAQLADPDRGWDAIVVGEYERAFYASQYASMAPLFEHYGVGLWMPEVGGRVDWHAEDHEQTMLALGLSSKREITRTRIRVRTAMAAQTREEGRYLGGRPPYGYRLADAGPHPNKAHAAWGRRAHRLEPDPATAPVVRWMFAQRLAGHSAARITRALNDAGIPCPSAADPGRNPHRTGARWTLRTVAAILANPRYTGRQVWNRQRTDFDLVDPADTGLGHRQVQRWNLPEGWVISRRPAHPALVSEADFIAAQDTAAPRRVSRAPLLDQLRWSARCGGPRADQACLDDAEQAQGCVEAASIVAGGGADGRGPLLADQSVVALPAPGRAYGHLAGIIQAGSALDEPLVLQPAQDGRQVGTLQAGRGGDTAGNGVGVSQQEAHDHAFGLGEWDGEVVGVAAELDLPGDDEHQVGQVRPPGIGGAGFVHSLG
jgi:site-specific DNA recombinase